MTGKATDFEEFIEELKAEGLWLIQYKQYQHSMVRRLVVSKKWQTKQSANMIIPHGTHAMGYHYYWG